MEKHEAAGKRIFITGGHCSNREIVEIIRSNFPQYHDQLPPVSANGGGTSSKQPLILFTDVLKDYPTLSSTSTISRVKKSLAFDTELV
jgi:hypothetical protein